MNYPYADTEDQDFADSDSWAGEDWESDYDDESWEAARRRRRAPQRPVPTAKGGNTFRGRGPSTGPVTQVQLEASLARVRQEVRANAAGIKTLDTRARTAAANQQRFETVTRKQVDKLRAELKTTQTLSALIPLIAPAGSKFASIAPLIHLVGPGLAGNSATGTGAGSPAGGLMGNTNNLIAIGALLYATGTFDK